MSGRRQTDKVIRRVKQAGSLLYGQKNSGDATMRRRYPSGWSTRSMMSEDGILPVMSGRTTPWQHNHIGATSRPLQGKGVPMVFSSAPPTRWRTAVLVSGAVHRLGCGGFFFWPSGQEQDRFPQNASRTNAAFRWHPPRIAACQREKRHRRRPEGLSIHDQVAISYRSEAGATPAIPRDTTEGPAQPRIPEGTASERKSTVSGKGGRGTAKPAGAARFSG